MATDKEKEELKAEMVKHFKAVSYLPAENIQSHGLMRAFIFDKPKTAPRQTGETQQVWKRVAEAREDFNRIQGFEAKEKWLDFVRVDNVKKRTSTDVNVAFHGTDCVKGDATFEVKSDVKFAIRKVTRHILDDSADAMGLARFLETFACKYVKADSDVRARILKDGIEHGRGDVIIGFESAYLTGILSDISHSSKNMLRLHGSGGGIGGEVGVSEEVTSSSKSEQVEGSQHPVFGSVFKVVHLQRRVLGTGTQRIQVVGAPVTLQDLGDNMLQDMFREAFPSLARLAEKKVREVVGGIFRKTVSDRADQLVCNTAPGKTVDNEDIDVKVFGSTGEPLFRDQAFDLALHDSWNYFFKLKKKTLVKMLQDLEEHGKTTYKSVAFTHLSVVRDYDLSSYIPIYFNWEARDYAAADVPSRVVCYKTPQAGDWCLRPVEGGKGKTVVTIYDNKWQVRESIVQVSNNDTSLQEELSKIGFHFVAEGQEDLKAVEGSTMMGRHELTPKDDVGTTIPNSVLEFREGLLCTMGSDLAEAGAGDRSSTPVITSAAELPPAPVVTNPTAPTPTRERSSTPVITSAAELPHAPVVTNPTASTPTRPGKKAKTDHFSKES